MVGTSMVCESQDGSAKPRRSKDLENYKNFDSITKEIRNDYQPIFPSSLTQKLKDEVDGLKCENVRLKKCLQETEKKLEDSKAFFETASPLRGLGRSSDLAASKIVELSKKVRELSAKLGSAQNKAHSAEAQLNVYMASKAAYVEEPIKDEDPSLLEQKENTIKELQEKLNSTNNKLFESRNQIQQLKHEIKLSQKVLANEVGDEVTVQNALTGSPTWRGRAQQIIALQQKVSELSCKLSSTDIPQLEKIAVSVAASERHADKEKMNALNREVEGLKIELNEAKTKLDACKARIKVLVNELGGCKAQIHNMTNKTSLDEQTIAKLTEQIGTMTEKAKEREELISKSLKDKINDLTIELNQEKVKVEQLKETVAEQEEKMIKLEAKASETKCSKPHSPGPFNEYGERPMSRASSFDRYSSNSGSIIQSSEAERLRLMELVSVLNKRLENERKSWEKTADDLRKERHRGAKLETRLARLEMEKVGCTRGSTCSSTYSKPKSVQSSHSINLNNNELEQYKDRCEFLQEKVLALETRIETLRQEKEEDGRIYQNIIEETRNTVKDHFRMSTKSPSIVSTIMT